MISGFPAKNAINVEKGFNDILYAYLQLLPLPDQCWLILKGVLWHKPKNNCTTTHEQNP